ncbi:MAG TPA: aspartate aminotransferase family protein [Acidimicrobiia bacterium]|jgi:glutamate-1-semialdehyde 2,1-aminomutase
MGLQGTQTAQWFERARNVLVNGVSSGYRYSGDDDTLVISHGEGGYIWDMDGRRYLDFQCGWGTNILGHGDPDVAAAVAEAVTSCTSFAMTQQREVEAAEKVVSCLRWPERMRFTNTGAEATMHAIRLARGVTGRDLILKFEGTYHGAHDYVLFTTPGAPPGDLGSRRRPIPHQASSGIPEAIRTYIRTLPFNDVEQVEAFFEDHGHEVAAILAEPMLGNSFGILPEPGFLETLRRLCDEYSSVLIFDEVKTGFRIGLGGAVEAFGVIPDIGTYAKAIGNGLPVAAIAMNARMAAGLQAGGIFQGGTYSGNGVSAAAVHATLSKLETGEPFRRIEETGTALMEGLQKILDAKGVESKVVGKPAMFSIFMGEGTPREFRDAARHDHRLHAATVLGMIERGVMPCYDALEPWFLCAAHNAEDVAITLAAFEESLEETLARAGDIPALFDEA